MNAVGKKRSYRCRYAEKLPNCSPFCEVIHFSVVRNRRSQTRLSQNRVSTRDYSWCQVFFPGDLGGAELRECLVPDETLTGATVVISNDGACFLILQ